jgi:hypothetical protein
VLPSNLRGIDISILVFNAGYYNEGLYGEKDGVKDKEKTERQMFPTIKKLNKVGNFIWEKKDGTKPPPFIYHLFRFSGASLNTEESGREYFSSISNEHGNTDYIKTSMSFDFGSVNYSNCFTNTFGAIDINQILISMTKIGDITGMGFEDSQKFHNAYESIFTDRIFENWASKFKDSWKGLGSSLLNTALNFSAKYVESAKLAANNIAESVIAVTDPSLLRNLTEKSLTNLMTRLDDKLYDKLRIRELNDFMRVNLSDRALNHWNNYEAHLLDKINDAACFKYGNNIFGAQELEKPRERNDFGHNVYIPEGKYEVDIGLQYTNPAPKITIAKDNFPPQLFPGDNNITKRKNF